MKKHELKVKVKGKELVVSASYYQSSKTDMEVIDANGHEKLLDKPLANKMETKPVKNKSVAKKSPAKPKAPSAK